MARRDSISEMIYRSLRAYNDGKAVERAIASGDPTFITDRVGRRLIGRVSSRLQRALFPSRRRR